MRLNINGSFDVKNEHTKPFTEFILFNLLIVRICTKIQKQFDPIVNVLTSLCVRKRSQKVVQHQRRQQGMTLGVRTREEMILQ